MSLIVDRFACDFESFPRVSGDEPFQGVFLRETLRFSPRERG